MNQAAEVKLVKPVFQTGLTFIVFYTGRSEIESSKETRYQKDLHVTNYNISIEKVTICYY